MLTSAVFMSHMNVEQRKFVSVCVGLAVWMLTFTGFAFYTWTAIHSGWSRAGMNRFRAAALLVPVVMGILAGWWTSRRLRRP